MLRYAKLSVALKSTLRLCSYAQIYYYEELTTMDIRVNLTFVSNILQAKKTDDLRKKLVIPSRHFGGDLWVTKGILQYCPYVKVICG